MRRKHLLPPDQGRRASATGNGALYPTAGALLRYERSSASTASTTWYDLSPSGNNGTAADANMFADFYFDSVVDQVIATSAGPSADFGSKWSLALWYKRDTSIATGYNTLMQNRVAGPNGGFILRDRTDPSPPADYSFEIVSPYQNMGTLVAGTDANWHFAVVVWTPGSPNTIASYIDGVFHKSITTANTPAAGGPLQIGKGFYYRFAGYIDTVRSYARALSADEILRDYNAGKAQHT